MPYLTYKVRRNKISKPTTLEELRQQLQNPIGTDKKYANKSTFRKEGTEIDDPTYHNLMNLQITLMNYIDLFPQATKESHFETFEIPKKTGGTRKIQAPDDDIKLAYTHVKLKIENDLKVLSHNSAWAYTEKRSTLDAVKQHQENESQWFLKVDIKKFFDECNRDVITEQLSNVYPFNHRPQITDLLADFATLNNALPQGTPLSPLITNLLMVPFDTHFNNYCSTNNFIYTRYADDMIISSKESFNYKKVVKKIKEIFEEHDYPFVLNHEKTRYGSRNGQNWNLGLMLNKDNKVTLGHNYKRQLKVILHKVVTGELPQDDPHIMGLFSYLRQIEPDYYEHLRGYCYRKHNTRLEVVLTGRL